MTSSPPTSHQLGLAGMARAFTELEANLQSADLSHAEWLGLLLDREATECYDRRLPLAAVAERSQPLQGTAAPWRAEVPRGGCRRLADRVLAHVRTSGSPTGAAQSVFRRPRSPPPLCSCPSLTRSNRRVRDPYARWWGRGGIARCPPIPINAPFSSLGRRRPVGSSGWISGIPDRCG